METVCINPTLSCRGIVIQASSLNSGTSADSRHCCDDHRESIDGSFHDLRSIVNAVIHYRMVFPGNSKKNSDDKIAT
jgi:hypothetical protein